MNGLKYPLEQLMIIKQNRYDQAVKALEERKKQLQAEEDKLREVEKSRDKVLDHKNEKLRQLREELDQGTTSNKIQQMKDYLKVVDEKLKAEEIKVQKQIEAVDLAKKLLDKARRDMFQREKDLEKLKIHKKEWEKEVQFWSDKKEDLIQDELGSATHIRKQKSKKWT